MLIIGWLRGTTPFMDPVVTVDPQCKYNSIERWARGTSNSLGAQTISELFPNDLVEATASFPQKVNDQFNSSDFAVPILCTEWGALQLNLDPT